MVETQAHRESLEDGHEYRDTFPLSDLREEPEHLFHLLHTELSHLTITVDGKAEAVLLSPTEYQRLLDIAADADFAEAIRQGTEDVKAGRTRPATEFFAEFRAKHGLPSRP